MDLVEEKNKTRKIREPIEISGKEGELKENKVSRYIDVLERLSKLMAKKGDPIRSRAYSKAQETIMLMTEDITNPDQLKGKPGIGPTIIEKLKEFDETGTLRIFEREKENPEHIFNEIYGVGPKKAKDLVEKGIKSIAELREKQNDLLNDVQKAGLKYYEDILERIPRNEIDEYNDLFKNEFEKASKTPGDKYEIVGSYRRGAQTSGDIDVIITSTDQIVFSTFIDGMKKTGIILELLSYGKTKCLVITKLPGKKFARRVDFMYSSPEEYPFAILYFTGSKIFNTVMRGHALKKGVSLNEHGLYKKESGKAKEDKIDVLFETEKDIFDYLKLEFKNPLDRIDGRSVVPIGAEEIKTAVVKNNIKTRKIREPKEKKPKTKKSKEPEEKKQNRKRTLKIRPGSPIFSIKKGELIKKQEESIPIVPVIPRVEIIKQETIMTDKKKRTRKKKIIEKDINLISEEKIDTGSVMNNISDFKANGMSALEKMTEKQLETIIKTSNDAYYNTQTSLMSDNEFDIIKEYMEKKYPKNKILEEVGAPIDKNKVTLPYEMASMDKIKPDTNALSKWTEKYHGQYVLSCKLDGVSGMYSTEGDVPKLYTRGNGKVGQDITHLLKVLDLPTAKGFVVRGEFIIPKAVFEEKYKSRFANPRNLVSGIINSKTIDEKTKDLHFVAYELIRPNKNPSEQLSIIEGLGFETVQHKVVDSLSNDMLSELLIDWRTNYKYEIDGIIVTDDNIHPRISGNPDYAFAFKMVISDQIAEAKVVDVIWTPSKAGYLKPRVRIEPIKLTGVTIEYATGFNASFIETNKIGIGAIIQIIRSGDVIPHIKSITIPAEHPKMPTVPYHWTDTHVDIILDNISEDITVQEKNITEFFKGLEVDGLSGGNVKRIMKAGFDSIPKILKMSKSDFEKVEGFKQKMVDKIYDGIKEKIGQATLLDIMSASNQFGRGIGERKIKPILEAYPNILTMNETTEQKNEMLKKIKGIGPENAKSFSENIPAFLTFLKLCDLEYKLTNRMPKEKSLENKIQLIDTNNPLYGKKIVMTKVRGKEIIDYIKRKGAILEDTMKKDVYLLIVKSRDDVSNKMKYAEENGIPIMTVEEFRAGEPTVP